MADRAKVIYDLERCTCHVPDACRDCSKYNAEGILTLTCMESLMKDALELLKEQEAVKPMVDIDTWVCGNCGARIERQSMIGPNVLISETLDVCPNCGKKVKWDETEGGQA